VTDDLRTRMVELLPRLRRFAYALTGDMDQGDDLVQEACARALSRLDQFQTGTRFDSWMFRIAQNLWLDRLRSTRSRGPAVDLDAVAAVAATDGRAVVESRLTLQAVTRAIAKLPAELQVLIALVCVEGRSYQEAAEITGTPIGTVMSRLARARRTLHELMDQGAQLSPEPPTEARHARS
jgi:RNA polymerase sigma-70 factor, ECF subfamily